MVEERREATLNDLLVAFGRLEAELKGVNQRLDRIDNYAEKRLDEHEQRIIELERENAELRTRVSVMESTRPKRTPAWTVVTGIVAVATILILVLDRFYVNK